MPIDPRTGEQVASLPSMDADGNIPTPRQVRRMEKALRKQVALMLGVVNEIHPPHPNSILALLDRNAFKREPPSVIILNALLSATAHLSSSLDFAKTKGANRITAWSLIRPALMSATTAGWVVVPLDLMEQLKRAAVVANEAMRYELTYADNVARIPGGQADERKAWIEKRLADLSDWAESAGVVLKPSRVPMTDAVREVGAFVGDNEARLSALWNEMSSGAHGLGWHIQSRTFGAGTTALEGSTFMAFPTELDRAYYFGVVADITDYTNVILSMARMLSTDITTLVSKGTLSIGDSDELLFDFKPPSIFQPDE